MFGLMIRIRRHELHCGNRRRRAFRHFVGIMDILDYARPRRHETGLDGPDLIEDIMGKPRKEQPEAESIFANNPFIEGLFEWMDSPRGPVGEPTGSFCGFLGSGSTSAKVHSRLR